MGQATVGFKQTQKVCEEMKAHRDGFFHLMCQLWQTDKVFYPIYGESILAMLLEHASVDALCFDSEKKLTISFECKYVSANRAPYVTLELTHQNGKAGWALDEWTMNHYIVFIIQGIGAVMCDMKAFQRAVKRNYDELIIRRYNGCKITKVHYDWLINEAGGQFYSEEELLHAESAFRGMLSRRLIDTLNEPGLQTFRYTLDGMDEMVSADKDDNKKNQTIGSSLAFNMLCCMALSTVYNVGYFLV